MADAYTDKVNPTLMWELALITIKCPISAHHHKNAVLPFDLLLGTSLVSFAHKSTLGKLSMELPQATNYEVVSPKIFLIFLEDHTHK
jgi:hypothetical protein